MASQGAQRRHVAVVVIGEFARSPRMMYHSLSLASDPETLVTLVGFAGHSLAADLAKHPRVCSDHLITPLEPPQRLRRSLFLLGALFRVLTQLIQFVYVLLWRIPSPTVVLVQTPPAVPLLAIAHLICLLRGANLVIDWHNLGYTLMEVDHRPRIAVWLYKLLERTFGHGAAANFCVSQCMQEWLRTQWNISATVLHDKPQEIFHEYPATEAHELFIKTNRAMLVPDELSEEFSDELTPFTMRLNDGQVVYRKVGEGRTMGLLVSSTSWTGDEDFGILLRALKLYDEEAQLNSQLPRLLVVITGNGPRRSRYEKEMQQLNLKNVYFRTGYLNQLQDYAILLSSAHLGVSLHTSSSGIDLPMKVVDMLGCHLPVIALSFPALPELLQDGVNGIAVTNDTRADHEIANNITRLLSDETALHHLKGNIHCVPWSQQWDTIARPVFERLYAAPTTAACSYKLMVAAISLLASLGAAIAFFFFYVFPSLNQLA